MFYSSFYRSAFKRVPFFGGKELDLFLLYKTVTSLGGCSKVITVENILH